MDATNKQKIELIQRSPEWHAYRKDRIGASDAPIICGVSPYKTIEQLWLEKTGQIITEFKMNWAMERGARLEPMIKSMIELMLDIDFEDSIIQSAARPFIYGSFDGNNQELKCAYELKIGNRKDHEALGDDAESIPSRIIVPRKYYPQMQQQMYVDDLDFIYYCSYYLSKGCPDNKGHLKIVKCMRDERFLEAYLPIADEFYDCMKYRRSPGRYLIEL